MSGGRVFLDKQTPSVYKAMTAAVGELQKRAEDAGIGRRTIELINIRCSQLNGCAYCLDIHVPAAKKAGETERRIAVLPAWRDTELFDDVEQVALSLAEAVTEVGEHHIAEDAYRSARVHLTDDQISVVIWAAILINAFNRLSILSQYPVTD